MRLAKRVLLSSLTVALVAASPAAALGNPTARPVTGTRTATTTLDLGTGAATTTSSGQLAHIGSYTGQSTEQFIPTSATTFSFAGTVTLVAANGDELFASFTGSGAFTSATTSTSTNTFTITGGTGRFDGASGTLTETIYSTIDSVSGTTQTSHEASTVSGTITY
jgi:hypothetical protein